MRDTWPTNNTMVADTKQKYVLVNSNEGLSIFLKIGYGSLNERKNTELVIQPKMCCNSAEHDFQIKLP